MIQSNQNEQIIKFGKWVSTRLNKYETILAAIFLVALVIKMGTSLDVSFLIVLTLMILANLYFFNAFSVNENATGMEIFLNKIISICCSVSMIGILFRLQQWSGYDFFLGIATLMLLISFVVLFLLKYRNKDFSIFNQRMAIRLFTIIIIDLTMLLAPYEALVKTGIINRINTESQVIRGDSGAKAINQDSIRIVAASILNGAKIWGKNEDYIFPVMDSLTNPDPHTRSFYFKVFEQICKQSDGYISEALGGYILKYFEFDPDEFIRNSALISDSAFKFMGYQAGLEIYLSNDDQSVKVLDKLMEATRQKTTNLNENDKNKLKTFFLKMKEGMESNME